jgi:hypothetical protein
MKRTARSPSSPRSARLSRSRRHAGSVLKHSCALAVTDIHPGRREPGRSGLQLESAAAVASARGRANPGQLPCALAEAARACRQDPGPAPRALRLPVQEPAVLHGSFHSESGGEADGWVALDVDWRDDRCVKFGKRTRRGVAVSCRGRARVSRCRRHFPDRADGHSSQARPEGEGLLSRVHDKADDEIIAKSLS